MLNKKWNVFQIDGRALETDAFQQTQEITRRPEVPYSPELPFDLQDVQGNFLVTIDGHNTSGRVAIRDIISGAMSPALFPVFLGAGSVYITLLFCSVFFRAPALAWVALVVQVLAWGLYSPIFAAIAALLLAGLHVSPGFNSAALLGLLVAVMPWALFMWERFTRNRELNRQGASVTETALQQLRIGKKARKAQAENAARDTSHFFPLGKATGYLASKGDFLAPDEGQEMGLTAADLSTHMIVLGATGSGKTSSIFRPLAKKWAAASAGGLFVADGKGQLPLDLAGSIEGYTVIMPENSTLAVIEGLTPEDVTDAIVSTQGKDETQPVFKQQGERLLRFSGILLEYLAAQMPEKYQWTLANILKIVAENDFRNKVLADISGLAERTPLILEAGTYFVDEFANQPERFQGSIIGTVVGWFSPLVGHRDLKAWTTAAHGEDVTAVLQGARLGLCLPSFRYGSAGAAITAMVKLRIYRAAQRRGDGWKKAEGQTGCLFLMDEAQEVLTPVDLDMAPVARSLGIYLCIGTQTVEQIEEKFGKAGSFALLAQLRSVVAFYSSPGTMEYIKTRTGKAYVHMTTSRRKNLDYRAGLKSAAASPAWDFNNPDRFAFSIGRQSILDVGKGILGGAQNLPEITVQEDFLLPEQLTNLVLSIPFHAFVSVQRGGVPRRDFVEMSPDFG